MENECGGENIFAAILLYILAYIENSAGCVPSNRNKRHVSYTSVGATDLSGACDVLTRSDSPASYGTSVYLITSCA